MHAYKKSKNKNSQAKILYKKVRTFKTFAANFGQENFVSKQLNKFFSTLHNQWKKISVIHWKNWLFIFYLRYY